MAQGYQPQPRAEFAALTELAAALTDWQDIEAHTKAVCRHAINDGCRASVIADALGMSRSTLYRWMGAGQ